MFFKIKGFDMPIETISTSNYVRMNVSCLSNDFIEKQNAVIFFPICKTDT